MINQNILKEYLGIKGIIKTKDRKYQAKLILGTFKTLEEATEVYNKAAKLCYGEFYRK